ncbi:phosphatase PAP2 family protein [Novisyntrophococcus fermenticellae]|uniref:phosphatase PAP2 family protein n=1 Tax=Novisyntrophococcus fermenticellae TaxID=2068655 RepID=UPI001E3CDEBD|nr:phosphatase PAP2 family protein [Novisyntrophococcus fermenticellae]
MDKIRKIITRIMPDYGFLPVVCAFMFNNVVYGGSKLVAGSWYHHNIESDLDQKIPFVPETLVIYFGCYLFWFVNYILIAKQDKKSVYQFFAGDFLSRCVCLFFYLIYPTTNTRPVITEVGFWNSAMSWLYSIDSASNLFPSIHCLVSWFCFIGIRGKKGIPLWYQTFSCIMAISVFISTLTTKQHVLVDIAGGVILAEVCFRLGRCTKIAETYGRVFERATAWLFPEPKGKKIISKDEG